MEDSLKGSEGELTGTTLTKLPSGFNKLIGNDVVLTTTQSNLGLSTGKESKRLYCPLYFWFHKNPSVAIPLIALQYADCKLSFTLRPWSQLYTDNANQGITNTISTYTGSGSINISAELYINYIYLDNEERNKVAGVDREYLIEQHQRKEFRKVSAQDSLKIDFKYMVKELVWVTQRSDVGGNDARTTYINEWNNYTNVASNSYGTASDIITSAKIIFNGDDLISFRPGSYYNLTQPYMYHTRAPNSGIYCFSFALEPEKVQPSGACNFTLINTPTLEVITSAPSLTTYQNVIRVYAINYNVLKIKNGIGTLAFAS
jgi:hypothetical protein